MVADEQDINNNGSLLYKSALQLDQHVLLYTQFRALDFWNGF